MSAGADPTKRTLRTTSLVPREAHCFIATCTCWYIHSMPEGWGHTGTIEAPIVACPEHLDSLRAMLGLPKTRPVDG